MIKTYQPKKKEVVRNWHLVDADKKVLGRLSSEVARLLMGKHKVNYSTHMDSGDFVVLINASKVVVTGKKADTKVYRSHSGYPGGFKEVKFAKLMGETPEKVILNSVSGMLPDNRLKRSRVARFKIFRDEVHPYADKFKNK
jgi:large subunit ribosomal protein L13